MESSYDYLIVGQGIAGTNLALTLMKNGQSVLVADTRQADSASRVAAGLFNPITGRKMSKTWLADELFPFLFDHYSALEKKLSARFFHPLPIYVPFDSIEKQNSWLGASAHPKYEGFLGDFLTENQAPKFLKSHFGGMLLQQSGYVETHALLNAAADYLMRKASYIQREIKLEELQFGSHSVSWNGLTFKKVLFCEGASNAVNELFSFLDYRRVKGEILLVDFGKEAVLDPQYIVNRGCWMIPLGENRYKVGSTYDFKQLDTQPTEPGRQRIEENLQELVGIPYEVKVHWAGVRPATYDRRPFIGLHPENPQVGIFNGMGSKGISLSPYFAQHFTDYLLGKSELLEEVRVNRKEERRLRKIQRRKRK